ncbi:MAG: indole-3-glycerol phosphate synthase TrpC [Fimbriimonadaceae bacterium]|nr:indole-3-glycerol phosphate synthase TrpC [Fimbriimonadaceae bacterium]
MNILDEIFEQKRHEVDRARSQISISELEAQGRDMPVAPFLGALRNRKHPTGLIAEVKKASPSQGLIRENFDALEIAAAYATAGAECLSVLTDREYFQGRPEYLKAIKENIAIPCLRKDFIYDPYQIYEARAWGADCVLLIVSRLEKSNLAELKAHVEQLGMDTLVEVHDEAECEVAIELGCGLVGINNRNLADFRTDLSTTERLAPRLKSGLPQALIVSESALETNEDISRVKLAQIDAVLIGTTFCASRDIAAKVKEVMGW